MSKESEMIQKFISIILLKNFSNKNAFRLI